MSETTHGGAMRPQCAGGLCIAIVKNESGIDRAASALANEMDSTGAHSGILLFSSELARTYFGPVPEEWSDLGIGIVVSRKDDLDAETRALFSEYDLGRRTTGENLRRLAALAKERAQRTAPKVPTTKIAARSAQSSQHVPQHSTTHGSETKPVHARQQQARPSVSGPLQRATYEGAMGAAMGAGAGADLGTGAAGGGVQEGRTQSGNTGGGSTQGAGSQAGGARESGTAQGSAGGKDAHSSGGTAGATGGGTHGRTRQGGKT